MAGTDSVSAATESQSNDLRQAEDRATSLLQQPISPDQLDAALRALRSDGWSSCWTGRRDRALLVLSQMAGLSFRAIAELTVAELSIADGLAVIRTPGGATTLRGAPDGRICGPCALARWLHALDLTAIYPNPAVVTAMIARASPLTANSPHLCQGRIKVCESTRSMQVLPRIDPWGPVTPRSPAKGAATRSSPVAQSLADLAGSGSRPIVTGRPPAAGLHQQLPVMPGSTEKAALVQATRDGSAQRQIVASPVFPRRLGLARSSYSRCDRDQDLAQSAPYVDGLEGRARALLDHSTL